MQIGLVKHSNLVPPALQHLPEIVAALAQDDLTAARVLVARHFKKAIAAGEIGRVPMPNSALRYPAYAQRNAERLRADIALNIWALRSVDRVIDNRTCTRQAERDQVEGAAG